jgi:hypothetical protein
MSTTASSARPATGKPTDRLSRIATVRETAPHRYAIVARLVRHRVAIQGVVPKAPPSCFRGSGARAFHKQFVGEGRGNERQTPCARLFLPHPWRAG